MSFETELKFIKDINFKIEEKEQFAIQSAKKSIDDFNELIDRFNAHLTSYGETGRKIKERIEGYKLSEENAASKITTIKSKIKDLEARIELKNEELNAINENRSDVDEEFKKLEAKKTELEEKKSHEVNELDKEHKSLSLMNTWYERYFGVRLYFQEPNKIVLEGRTQEVEEIKFHVTFRIIDNGKTITLFEIRPKIKNEARLRKQLKKTSDLQAVIAAVYKHFNKLQKM